MPIQLIIRNPLDRDAREYIQRAGVSNAAGRAQINEFVRGIKGLGLWNSMVCWPLRSTQNAGTGTTAYSLGGLGTYNGTLVNGPTWGTDGIVFDTAIKRISFPINWGMGRVKSSVFEASISDTSGSNLRVIGGLTTPLFLNNVFAPGIWLTYAYDNAPMQSRGSFVQLPINTNTLLTLGQVSSVRSEVSKDRNVYAGANSPTPYSTNLTSVDFMTDTTGRASFFLVTADGVALSQTESNALQNLYKQTLGTGLGLP
jgi:hypothetical protein